MATKPAASSVRRTPRVGGSPPSGEGRVVGLDEDHTIGGDAGKHLGGIAHARCDRDAVGAVLDEGRQRSLLALEVVQPGHDEDRISLGGGGFLEARRDLAVDGIGEVVEEQSEDVRPACAQAACRGVGDVAELECSGANGRTRRRADPRVVLERARRSRLGRPGDPGDVGENDPSFRGSAHPARLDRPMRPGEDHPIGPLAGRVSTGTHGPMPLRFRDASGGLCNRLRGR